MGTRMIQTRALLFDMDNTLYDWLSYFGPSFRGMCAELSKLTGSSYNRLYDEFKVVFTRHRTVEYSWAIQELPSVQGSHPALAGSELVRLHFDAVQVFQQRRRTFLRLYPEVREGLEILRNLGVQLYAVTDARRFHAVQRLRQLKLIDLLDGICCIADHADPGSEELSSIRRFDGDVYSAKVRYEFILPVGLRKPSPEVLNSLLSEIGVATEDAIYVGDSLVKDIQMAQQAGVYDCWAQYGTSFSPIDMHTLIRVTDWPAALVSEILSATPESLGIRPSVTATSFRDVVEVVTMPASRRPTRERPFIQGQQLPLFEIGANASDH